MLLFPHKENGKGTEMLTLFEELFLLSIHEDKGTYIKSSVDRIKPGLVGAILAELALLGKFQTNDNHRLHLLDTSPTGDELLDEVLEMLKGSEKERKWGYWVSQLNQKFDKVSKTVSERLVEKGIVTQDDDHMVWVTPSPFHPEVHASTKYMVNQHLRSIVLAQKESGPRELALLGLLRACGLLDLTFLRDERRFASRHINQMMVSAAMKDPLAQTLQEIETAIAVVVEDD